MRNQQLISTSNLLAEYKPYHKLFTQLKRIAKNDSMDTHHPDCVELSRVFFHHDNELQMHVIGHYDGEQCIFAAITFPTITAFKIPQTDTVRISHLGSKRRRLRDVHMSNYPQAVWAVLKDLGRLFY